MKLGFQAFGQLLDGAGLGKPRRALDEQVAVGQQGNQQSLDQTFLAKDLG